MSTPDTINFASLRQRGMAYIQAIAGNTWTDHNAHDPGITILEQICYTLTDLAYRADYDVRDLLAGSPGGSGSLFPASEILTANPVTLLDLRKIVLDVNGVKNAWIEPATVLEPPLRFDPANDPSSDVAAPAIPLLVRGVYLVLVAPERRGLAPADIARRLNGARPLGLDFLAPQIMPEQKVGVVAEIEIDPAHPPDEVWREVYRVAAEYISPSVRFRGLEEMRARGLALDEIFDGPNLRHGFVDTGELAQAGRATELYTSKLMALLMDVGGVRAVYELRLRLHEDEAGEPWVLKLASSPDSPRTPVLDPFLSEIILMRGQVRWSPPVLSALTKESPTQVTAAPAAQPSPGIPREVELYPSFQHDLPQVYGLGLAGLPAAASPARRAQVHQLRAYLMFFDQLLANAFSQLAHAPDLFSFTPTSDKPPTYFGQLADVPYAADILPPDFKFADLLAMLETPDQSAARQQKFLDHLLARFAEDFGGYTLRNQDREPSARTDPQRAFLRDYPAVSGGLGRGFDYTQSSWGEANRDNVSGLEKRIAYKLGLADYHRRALAGLSSHDPGGFHLIENLLLRPGVDDAAGEARTLTGSPSAGVSPVEPLGGDLYSGRLSFVFPAWIERFGGRPEGKAGPFTEDERQARSYVEQIVRAETPAHLRLHVHWFSREDMEALEPAYRTWLESRVFSA